MQPALVESTAMPAVNAGDLLEPWQLGALQNLFVHMSLSSKMLLITTADLILFC